MNQEHTICSDTVLVFVSLPSPSKLKPSILDQTSLIYLPELSLPWHVEVDLLPPETRPLKQIQLSENA
jgi:hypothetical protein